MFGIDPLVIAFGLGVGILIGLTGIGGGSLMTPLLIIVIGTQPVVAVGTDVAYGAITKTLGGWRHLRKGTVDMTVSKWLAFGSVPGALAGVLAIDRLHHHYGKSFDKVLFAAVAIALIIVAAVVLTRAIFLPRLAAREGDTFAFTTRTRVAAIALGFVLGGVLGLTSVGSGALISVALIVLFRLTPRRVVGTDVFHAALLLWVAGIAQAIAGNIDYGLMGSILIGSIPGVWIGAQLIDRVASGALRVMLGAVLVGSALALVSKTGHHVPVGAILGAPLLVGAFAYAVHRRRGIAGEAGAGTGRGPAVAAPPLPGAPAALSTMEGS